MGVGERGSKLIIYFLVNFDFRMMLDCCVSASKDAKCTVAVKDLNNGVGVH